MFFTPPPPVTNYMLLYSTLLHKKIACAPGGVKNISPLSWGMAKQNRSEISTFIFSISFEFYLSGSLLSSAFKRFFDTLSEFKCHGRGKA